MSLVESFESAANAVISNLSLVAKIALQRIEVETTDRGLKDRIRAAISN